MPIELFLICVRVKQPAKILELNWHKEIKIKKVLVPRFLRVRIKAICTHNAETHGTSIQSFSSRGHTFLEMMPQDTKENRFWAQYITLKFAILGTLKVFFLWILTATSPYFWICHNYCYVHQDYRPLRMYRKCIAFGGKLKLMEI